MHSYVSFSDKVKQTLKNDLSFFLIIWVMLICVTVNHSSLNPLEQVWPSSK